MVPVEPSREMIAACEHQWNVGSAQIWPDANGPQCSPPARGPTMQLDIQQRANRAQALARASGNPAQARKAAALQSRADRLHKIDKRILRALLSGAWLTFGDVCAAALVAPGAHIRADYTARLGALIASGKIERRGARSNIEYRRVPVDMP